MLREYSFESRSDRLIAAGRVALAACALGAVLLDPSEPPQYADIVEKVVAGYLVYAVVINLLVWRAETLMSRQRVLIHLLDLATFSIFIWYTGGTDSVFSLGFVFAVACASLQWQWRGALWTGTVSLGLFAAISLYATRVGPDPAPDLDRLVIKATWLAVLSVVLGYLGVFQSQIRVEMQKLAVWPSLTGSEILPVMRAVLSYAGEVLGTDRAVMIWDEPEEPGRRLVWWARGEFHATREPPGTLEPLVDPALADVDFLCRDAGAAKPEVLYTTPTGLGRWRGAPLHPEMVARFGIGPVLCVRLGQAGRLFLLDRRGMTPDDLWIGQIVAYHVTSSLEHAQLLNSLEATAVTGERMRLARDLHDGVLQSLTAIALQVEAIARTMEPAIRKRVETIQSQLADEQRLLRLFIQQLKPSALSVGEDDAVLSTRLAALCRRVERDWGLRVDLEADDWVAISAISGALAHDVFFIVHEALINAARHAGASTARVRIGAGNGHLTITIADDGHGFAFQGRYDASALKEMNLAPSTLHDRVAALGGRLVIESNERGALVDVELPSSAGR